MKFLRLTAGHAGVGRERNTRVMKELNTEPTIAFRDASIHPFSRVRCNAVNISCVMGTVHQTKDCRFVWHRRIGKCDPKLIMAS
jgi:hypothetical protein